MRDIAGMHHLHLCSAPCCQQEVTQVQRVRVLAQHAAQASKHSIVAVVIIMGLNCDIAGWQEREIRQCLGQCKHKQALDSRQPTFKNCSLTAPR